MLPSWCDTKQELPRKKSNTFNDNERSNISMNTDFSTSQQVYNENSHLANDIKTKFVIGENENVHFRKGLRPKLTEKLWSDVCSMSKYFRRIEDYVCAEADFDIKTCGFFNQDMLIQGVRDQSSPFADVESSNIHYDNEISNREVLELLSCVKTLKSGVVTCMMAITECIESRRTIYLTQLRKIRDMSNMAIRNAIQNEKAEANSALTRLRNTLELKNNSALEAALVKMHQLETENLELRERIDNLNSVVKELKEKDQDRVVIQNRAVVAALSLRDEEQRQERHQQAQWTETEIARVVAESSLKIQTVTLQSKCDQDAQRRHDSELRELLVAERSRLERECDILREQMTGLRAEIGREKEAGAARLADERTRSERHLQDSLSESVRAQTQLKMELSEMALHMTSQNSRQSSDLDAKMAKFRETLLTSHAVELETLNERHKAEIKRVQAELQVRAHDAAVKSKHLFEQELSRLLRENDRLQKIVVRNGGSALFNKHNDGHDDPVSVRNISTASLTPGGSSTRGRDMSARQSSSGHWGSLSESLRMQENMDKKDNVPTARPPPPAPFGVDEAYQSSLNGRSSGGGRGEGIGSNAKRITGYMGRLEEYLTRQEDDRRETSLDESVDLSRLAGNGVHGHRRGGGVSEDDDSSSNSSDTNRDRDSLEKYSLGSAANLIVDLSGRTSSNMSAGTRQLDETL